MWVWAGGKFARKHVPINLRQLLSAESAANDGLAYPFLTLTLYLTLDKSDDVAIGHWFLIGWLCRFYLDRSCANGPPDLTI
jgi:NhaP-type Na+/H+ or K+/H+ antiporter